MAWACATCAHAKFEYETVVDDSDLAERAPSNVGGTPRERPHTQVTHEASEAVGHFFKSAEPLRQDGCRKVVVDDITSRNFASILGDFGMSSASFLSVQRQKSLHQRSQTLNHLIMLFSYS